MQVQINHGQGIVCRRVIKWRVGRAAIPPKAIGARVLVRPSHPLSFAFSVPSGGDSWQENGAQDEQTGQNCYLRTLKDVDLLDVSICTYPAYYGTDASARAQFRSVAADYGIVGNDEATKRLVEAAARRAFDATRPSDPYASLKMVYIRLICDHPTLGTMGTYTAAPRYEAESLVERGYAKFDRP